MEGRDDLLALRGLHQDLVSLSESRLSSIDKLCVELEAHIDAFRKLIDKKPRQAASRKTVEAGKITVDDVEYSLNDEFKEQALQLADTLDLDEVDSAALLLKGSADAEKLDRTPLSCSVIRFQEYRSFLLESLRLILKLSLDLSLDDHVREIMQRMVTLVLGSQSAPSSNGSQYARKMLKSMADVEAWIGGLADQVQKGITLGQVNLPAYDELIGLQQQNLTQQHESLGVALMYLVKGNYTRAQDFEAVLEQLSRVDKWSVQAVHYAPSIISLCAHFGSSDGSISHDEAKTMHRKIVEGRESRVWPLRQLHAAVVIWWLAEYNSWYFDQPAPEGDAAAKEAQARSDALYQALHDGGLQCSLSICTQIKPDDWSDPARADLVASLLNDAPMAPFEAASVTPYFQEVMMEQFEAFTDAFITNMPDNLRKFKVDEDDQRRRMLSGAQISLQDGVAQSTRHLERFFVIMSYVYGGRPEASEQFWSDPDSNMYGFLQWFSRRVSTPLMAAFCELFRAISEGEDSAAAAHTFLLDESPTSSSRIRRSSSLSWAQMFEELEFYSSKVRDTGSAAPNGSKPVDVDEPETAAMLECYLRLVAHLCAQSRIVRNWVLTHSTFKLVDTLFALCNYTVPARVRACAFSCARGLLVDKSTEVSDQVWTALDQWVANGFVASANAPRPLHAQNWTSAQTLESVCADFDEATAFVRLVSALLQPAAVNQDLRDTLPFPENLGGSYRMPGVDPYIDQIMGKVFARKLGQLDRSGKQHVLAYYLFDAIETVLESFNENLIVLANNSSMDLDKVLGVSLSSYTRLHPFCRVMEWIFNENVLATILSLSHEQISKVNNSRPESSLVSYLTKLIGVLNLVMDLQPTFLDVVLPLVRKESGSRKAVMNPAIVSLEDVVSSNLRIFVDLCYYSSSGHQDLALASFALLKKLASSKRLNTVSLEQSSSRILVNRLISALQQQNDVEPIAIAMGQTMEFDELELSLGPQAAGFNVKYATLDFLESALAANRDRPNVAHALLGFACSERFVRPGETFEAGASLFHAVLKLSIEYPEALDGSMQSWSLSIKQKALDILKHLWSAPLTSSIVLGEMKALNVSTWFWMSQSLIDSDTPWDACPVTDQLFVYRTGATGLRRFLQLRSALFSYVAAALRLAVFEESSLLRAQTVSTLLGVPPADVGNSGLTIFDLLDFMELRVAPPQPHEWAAAEGIEFSVANRASQDEEANFDLTLVEQMLCLCRDRAKPKDETAAEIQGTLSFVNAFNSNSFYLTARHEALKSWAELVIVLVQNCGLDKDAKAALVLQAIQTVAPKFEFYTSLMQPESLTFARLAQRLLSQLDFQTDAFESGRSGDVAHERLFHFFQIALKAVSHPDAQADLRECLYNICCQYLAAVAHSSKSGALRQQINRSVRAGGDSLVDVISDDAYSGEGTCRISALLLLDLLVRTANDDSHNKYLVESLVRTNFIVVLVETISEIPEELRQAHPADIPLLLSYHKTKLTLLLSISQSRPGAVHVLNAGLFAAVRNSGLFAADPDLGLEIDNFEALGKYYSLLLFVLRIITTVVLSRGAQNLQTIEASRNFLSENRLSMVGIFKRQAKIVESSRRVDSGDMEEALNELVESYVLLVSLTGFLESDGDNGTQKGARNLVFS